MSNSDASVPTRNVPVIVTTEYKGVFFGYVATADMENKALIRLDRAKCCIYWDRSIGGFLGLAAVGPNESCRIGNQAEHVVLHGITSVSLCSSEAESRWLKA